MSIDNFINNNGYFVWFTGVIEDIDDPLQRGRYRVRCYGYHTDDKVLIPTEDLPWAHVMLPITSASMSGIGESATGLLRGSWVVGFFRDGPNAQDPVIMGSIPSTTNDVDYTRGFTDPQQQYPSQNKLTTPDTPVSAQSSKGDEVGAEPVYKSGFSYSKKKEIRSDTTHSPDGQTSNNTGVSTSDGRSWTFRKLDDVHAPVYPYNHVKAHQRKEDDKEDAHIEERDVTPGKERISTMHRTGTYHEITPFGDEECYIMGNEYQIIVKDKNVYVKGTCNLTIDGNCNTLIEGDWDIECRGNKHERIHGDNTLTINGNSNQHIKKASTEKVDETFTETVGGNVQETYKANQTTNVSGNQISDGSSGPGGSVVSSAINGNFKIKATRIDLN